MNKVFLSIIIASLLVCKLKAQTIQEQQATIVPLVQYQDYKKDEIEIPINTYFKDVDGDLTKYIGTWDGTYNGKSYELVVTKRRKFFIDMSMDILEVRYKITETDSGAIVANTLEYPVGSPYVIFGRYMSQDKSYYSLYYIGFESKCGQNGYMSLRVMNSTSNTMKLKYTVEGEKVSDACASTAQQIFPVTQDLVLTKQ